MTEESDPEGLTRRDLVKVGLVVGGVTAAAAAGATILPSLLRPESPVPIPTEPATDTIRYTRFPTPQWWNDREGRTIRVTDFQEWQGATGIWRASYANGNWVPGTGTPVLVIRVKRDDSVFIAPPPGDVSLPSGFDLYYDDPARDIRIVVAYVRCTHLCCYAGWHVVTSLSPPRDYAPDSPTYRAYGLDPIWCICHDAQFDPMVLRKDVNPTNGVTYVGLSCVHRPALRAIPIIPIKAIDDVLVGGMADSRWYQYC